MRLVNPLYLLYLLALLLEQGKLLAISSLVDNRPLDRWLHIFFPVRRRITEVCRYKRLWFIDMVRSMLPHLVVHRLEVKLGWIVLLSSDKPLISKSD